jgi:hypothetical protein
MPSPRRCLVIVTLIAALHGCAPAEEVSGEAGVCGLEARFDGRTYVADGGFRRIPDYGERLGAATVPSCGTEPAFEIDAVAIVGIDPATAFASPAYEDVVFTAEDLDALPAELMALRRQPRCSGDEVELDGPWLGIIGRDGNTEVDLVPPYDLDMRVDTASSPRYERAFITVLVEPELGAPLMRHDLRTSLWDGGTIHVVAACRDGAFEASQLSTAPPS